MKEAITGYITGVINCYTRSITKLNKLYVEDIKRFEAIRDEFSDLLDFVEDLPEQHNSEENKVLRKQIIELEKNCEGDCKVIMVLYNRIRELEEKLKNLEGK